VVFEGGDVFGDGVNVASRLEPLAEPGGICVSGRIYDDIRNKPDIETVFLGEKRLKHVKRPVKVYALAGEGLPTAKPEILEGAETEPKPTVIPNRRILVLSLGILAIIAGYTLYTTYFAVPGKIETIVVLPFENLGAAEEEYFADGVTEEITSRLAMIHRLGVISRTSAIQYKNAEKSIKEIGRELGVDYVLEGTIRWQQTSDGLDRVRVTPQLINVSDDTHLWANHYDADLTDIFEVQSDIAKCVIEALDIVLWKSEPEALEASPTDNLEAYQAYLRGRYYAGRPHFSLENWMHVLQSYQQAVDLDPNFALAYAQLSKGHARLYYFQHDLSKERLELAKHAAERALELAPDSPEVHRILSYYYLWAFRDPDQALKELEIAEKGLHNNAEVLEAKAYVFQQQGRFEEARYSFEEAFKLSPRDADLPTELIFIFWLTREYPLAIEATDQAITIAPNEVWPYLGKALIYWSWNGDTEAARAALEAVPTEHSWLPWFWLWQEIFEGEYQHTLERLSSLSNDWIRLKILARPKSLLSAYVYEYMDEPQNARRAYEAAESVLEIEVKRWPEDPRLHSSLGIVYAALGRPHEAIREGKQATELLPVSKDAFYGLPYAIDLAHIYTLAGEYDAALDQIEYLLSIPSWISIPWLQIDPRWDPLRELPRFQKLVEKYGE
ncbi:MAG: tetratricopeptide repeat protein, partial [Candidatus Marinimicrobia bacterium]|nr:tetratricopeptide repeat protein [Candidatus Neomarinimicrobiota bacterium]